MLINVYTKAQRLKGTKYNPTVATQLDREIKMVFLMLVLMLFY